jgi:LPXTG-motif cell wall-anchored protein
MSKIKKILAVVLTLAMVLAMSVTSFAESDGESGSSTAASANITINNPGSGTFKYGQIIQPDTSKRTGWAFVDDDIKAEFIEAFSIEENDDQSAIDALISIATGGTANTSTEFAEALNNVLNKATESITGYTITVYYAGVYVISGEETGYSYSPMAAYVSFGDYDTSKGIPTALTSTSVEAKKAPQTISKTSNVKDKITEIGRTENYTITSTVPFLPLSDSNRVYKIVDTIRGANYVTASDGDNAGKVAVTVKIGSTVTNTIYASVISVAATETTSAYKTFTLDLSKYLDNNTYANQTITLTYSAIVNDVTVANEVKAVDRNGEEKYGTNSTDLYTGQITLTKYATMKKKTVDGEEVDDPENTEKLAGAKFVVYKEVNGTTSYATFDDNSKFSSWVSDLNDATEIETASNGTVTVYGLDEGTYKFKEVVAPTGYSINTSDVSAILTLTGDDATAGVASAVLTAETYMTDTKLSELPSTGGIGTTIFTVIGCLIMIAAAAMFFVSRRRTEK